MRRLNPAVAIGLQSLLFLVTADTYAQGLPKLTFRPGVISTLAGSGAIGYSGDQGPAFSATFRDPSGLALGTNALYVADTSNHAVRKISLSDFTISTVAGTGASGYSGDGGPAVNARLCSPLAVAVDAAGDLFIADTGNNVIREVDVNGEITTVVGKSSDNETTQETPGVGDGGNAIAAILWHPSGISFDTVGNLYIADTYDNRIRKVDKDTNTITTIAGSGVGGYSGDGGSATAAALTFPYSMAIDGNGDIAVADANNVIRWIDSKTGRIFTIAGGGQNPGADSLGDGGQSTGASLLNPMGLSFDAAGTTLFVSDSYHALIRAVDTRTWQISVIAGMDPSRRALADSDSLPSPNNSPIDTIITVPAGLVSDPTSGFLYFVDSGADVLWRVSFTTGSLVIYGGVDSTTTQNIAFKNTGATASNMSFELIGNTDFSVSQNTCASQLAAGNTCQATVSFSSHSGENAHATLLILDEETGSTGPIVVGSVLISGQTSTSQASECMYLVGSPDHLLPAEGGVGEPISINTAGSCGWTADTNSSWITVTGGTNGTGPAMVSYVAEPNPTPTVRTGAMYIAGQVLMIVQAGTSASFVTPPPRSTPSVCGEVRQVAAGTTGRSNRSFILWGSCQK